MIPERIEKDGEIYSFIYEPDMDESEDRGVFFHQLLVDHKGTVYKSLWKFDCDNATEHDFREHYKKGEYSNVGHHLFLCVVDSYDGEDPFYSDDWIEIEEVKYEDREWNDPNFLKHISSCRKFR